ncbi:DNA mismatch repair endonuclease MutL [Ruminiclostridium cellulolyticum]|uniref:DNA mismatch repair protein MutL n=1 Tax=Ruminiclostridium cellulolyticum (strain ATCC 35319 / DSM 5812 / JCM 6584 / H10) TaxID=394503 RepID=B8I2Q4_RUMCH|nr:DNA mismatch repair endonuclease MutL [Ruminiclostridium cellulolyticum]ACL76047.1 DNA mismatch repair protein MutL [Ruminiclostridium cellulolyticum H10]
MGRIIVLDENTSNKIAAGEVVEKPASVVKELVENSIDAGATSISVDIKNGGISYIKIADNGIGMDEDDVEIAFERHATSKIKRAEDLDSVITMGFRGEALASIASVASVELMTKTAASAYGMYVHVRGGVLQDVRQTGCPVGTTFIIKDLFFNTPARYKFLKKDSTEAGYISDTISRIALGNPNISFKLTNGKTPLIHTPGNNDLKSVIYSIYGKEIIKNLVHIEYADDKVKISGYIGKPEAARSNRNYQSLYINKRYVKSKLVSYSVEQAFSSILMKNRFPFFVLNIDINPILVDANVHPAKIEVRFADESYLSRTIYMAVSNALTTGGGLFNPVSVPDKDRELFKFADNSQPKKEYVQNEIQLNNKQEENKKADEIRLFTKALEPLAKVDVHKVSTAAEKQPADTSSFTFTRSEDYNVGQPKNLITNVKQENSDELKNNSPGIREDDSSQNFDETINKQDQEVNKERVYTELADMKYIGQAFSTYILLQNNDELVMVDQHAAHERIIYEKLRAKFDSQENTTQLLLEPVVIQLQPFEIDTIKAKEKLLTGIGFVYEDFGNNTIIIRGIPYMVGDYSPRDIFIELTQKLQESIKPVSTPLADEIIHTIACKAAIKANKKLDEKEVHQLLTELSNTGRRYTCPHGRPTVIRLTKNEIEKMFKRIV